MEFATTNPATNTLVKSFAFDTEAEVLAKIERTHAGFVAWRKLSIKERGEKLQKVAELMEERKAELAKLLTLEMGKPEPEALQEVQAAWEGIKLWIGQAEDALKPRDHTIGYKKAQSVYQPIGVIYSITPWNFPVIIPIQQNVQGMLAGNTVLNKPAPSCPQIGLAVAQIFADAGLAEQYQPTLASTEHTELVIGHPHVAGVTFTGSCGAGKIVAALAGKYMKKASFELGGSDPFIVLEDADLAKAVQIAVNIRLVNAGQVCISPKRMIIADALYEKFKEELLTTLRARLDSPAKLGPMARSDLLAGLKKQVQETIDAGAKVVFGDTEQLKEQQAEGQGNFFSPVVLEDVAPSNPGFHYEFFGPVFVLYRVEGDKEAVSLANSVEYGLGGAVFSQDEERAQKVAMEVETGSMTINAPFFPNFALPFGGTKASGYGREGGLHGFHEFTNAKTVAIP